MISLFKYMAPPHACSYLPDQVACMEYEYFTSIAAGEYEGRMKAGWRRFGSMLFRPSCRSCRQCQPLRIPVDRFQANRSQRRTWVRNHGEVERTIDAPGVSRTKLKLYDRYHVFQADFKDWPRHPPKDSAGYRESFIDNPFPTEEWCWWIGDRLVGVGYVDCLPNSLSAIYFYYDPEERDRSLGTYNVLAILEEAARRKIPHVYMGYYVAGCRSLAYKANFRPCEILTPEGQWTELGS